VNTANHWHDGAAVRCQREECNDVLSRRVDVSTQWNPKMRTSIPTT